MLRGEIAPSWAAMRTLRPAPSDDCSVRSIWSTRSTLSVACRHGLLSVLSSGSILSFGSTGSVLSIGSAGSILSIASAGSILSVGSAGSILSIGSVASIKGRFSFLHAGLARPDSEPSVRRVAELAGRTIAVGAVLTAAAGALRSR